MKRLSFLLILLIVFQAALFAEKFEMKNGEVREGKILDQDASSIIIETDTGVMNVRKDNLKVLPPGVTPPKDPVFAPAFPGSQGSAVPQSPLTEDPEVQRLKQLQEQQAAVQKARGLAEKANDFKALPSLEWARNFSKEASAKNRLRKIAAAMQAYGVENEKWPMTLKELIDKNMLGPEFETGTVEDYRYELQIVSPTFKILASPADPQSKLSSFIYDSKEGKIENQKASS